jgi:hypothetical protein
MNNEVDFTFGFSRWIVATGTPDFDEMTPKVSPACTVQNRGPDLVVLVPRVVVCDVTVFWGCVTTADVVVDVEEPACRPERMSRMAIVAASRNAAGATYRRLSSRGTTSRMRSRSPA